MNTPERRKRLTRSQWLALFELQHGKCGICKEEMRRDEKIRDEHMRALGLLGSNDLSNRRLVHEKCALKKNKDDIPRIARAKKQKVRSYGYKQPKGRPLPGTKASGWRHRMNGAWEKWT